MEHGLAYDNGYASQRTGCRPFQMVGVREQDWSPVEGACPGLSLAVGVFTGHDGGLCPSLGAWGSRSPWR